MALSVWVKFIYSLLCDLFNFYFFLTFNDQYLLHKNLYQYKKKRICIKTLFEIDDFKFLLNSLIGCFSVHGETGGEIRALEPKIYNPSHTSAKITGLQPNNHYRFFVWARTSSGQGDKKTVEVLTKGIDLARRQYCNYISQREKLIFKLVWMKKNISCSRLKQSLKNEDVYTVQSTYLTKTKSWMNRYPCKK